MWQPNDVVEISLDMQPRFWVGEVMAAWMLAMVLTRVVYWPDAGSQVPR